VVGIGIEADWGCLGCSTGLGVANSEGPDPVPPTLGKANVDFVVEVVPVVLGGIGWLVGNENVGAGVAVRLEVVIVGGAGAGGLEKKLGTAELVAVMESSGFVVEAGTVVVAGFVKKLGAGGCAGAGRVVEVVGAGVGVANKFFEGSLVSVVVVGFGCVEAAEAGVNKPGVAVLVIEVVIVGLSEIAGAGAGEGFLSSATFFWS